MPTRLKPPRHAPHTTARSTPVRRAVVAIAGALLATIATIASAAAQTPAGSGGQLGPALAPPAPPPATFGTAAPPGAPQWQASPGGGPQLASVPLWANPRTIVYEEGDPVPSGYALRTRPSRPLLIGGLVTFGSAYAVSLVAGTATLSDNGSSSDDFAPLLIPFVGPLIAIPTSDAEGAGIFWLVVDATVQTGGLLLFVAGLADEDTYLERQGSFDNMPQLQRSQPVSLRPEVSIGLSSASLRWRF